MFILNCILFFSNRVVCYKNKTYKGRVLLQKWTLLLFVYQIVILNRLILFKWSVLGNIFDIENNIIISLVILNFIFIFKSDGLLANEPCMDCYPEFHMLSILSELYRFNNIKFRRYRRHLFWFKILFTRTIIIQQTFCRDVDLCLISKHCYTGIPKSCFRILQRYSLFAIIRVRATVILMWYSLK